MSTTVVSGRSHRSDPVESKSRLVSLLSEAEQLVQNLAPDEATSLLADESLPNLTRLLLQTASGTSNQLLGDRMNHQPSPVMGVDEPHLTHVLNALPVGVAVLDSQRRVRLGNSDGLRKLARLARAGVGEVIVEMAGMSFEHLLKLACARSKACELTTGGETYSVVVLPTHSATAHNGWLILLRNVLREHAAKAGTLRHERLASLGLLTAGVAHDFNNIVSVILLYVQLLERGSLRSPEDVAKLGVIHEQAQLAAQLTRQILDISRPSIGEMQVLDLCAIVDRAADFWQRTLPRSVRVKVEADPEPCRIWGDPTMVQQVLTNLAINARDAMPDGGELAVTAKRLVLSSQDIPVAGMRPGTWIQLAVRDSGCGICPEHLPRLFDPFFTTKPVGEGTGLGLSQVVSIVRQHQGYVGVESEPGKGTCFSIYLPCYGERIPQAVERTEDSRGRSDRVAFKVEAQSRAVEAAV